MPVENCCCCLLPEHINDVEHFMFTGAFSNSNGPSGWDSEDIELNLYMVFTGVPLQGKVGGWLPTTRCRSDGHPRSFLQSQQVTLPWLCTHFIISCYSHYWGWFSHLGDSNTHASWEWRMLGYWRLTGRCFNTDFGDFGFSTSTSW